MKKAIVHLQSNGWYGQGMYHQTVKFDKELPAAYEERTWREKAHYNENGIMFIPGNQLASAVREAAKYLSLSVPGKGKSTYTKNFESGIMVEPQERILLNVTRETVKGIPVFVPSDGKAGGSKRVMKFFPVVEAWEGQITFKIHDDLITADIFERVIKAAGELIGIGYWRPRNRGYYGRFKVLDIKWFDHVDMEEEKLALASNGRSKSHAIR